MKSGSTLSDRLKAVMRERGLRLHDLASMLGRSVPYSSLGEVHRGRAKTSKYTPKIAIALGVNALWLSEGIGPKERGEDSAEPGVPAVARRLHNSSGLPPMSEDELDVMTMYRNLTSAEQDMIRAILNTHGAKRRGGRKPPP
jgi:hypothetical protein